MESLKDNTQIHLGNYLRYITIAGSIYYEETQSNTNQSLTLTRTLTISKNDSYFGHLIAPS